MGRAFLFSLTRVETFISQNNRVLYLLAIFNLSGGGTPIISKNCYVQGVIYLMSITGILLRFLLGGSAVAASAVIGQRLGGRIGGIFAAFPAVFASAVISTTVGLPQMEAVRRTIIMSRGALVGMIVNIGCAIATGWLITRFGWKKGLLISLSGWLVVAASVFCGGAWLGWLK
jgi:hypothetical protein